MQKNKKAVTIARITSRNNKFWFSDNSRYKIEPVNAIKPSFNAVKFCENHYYKYL
ncbi:hypothetical protein EfmAA242_00280 [Enterococcus faecium]|nr:hypothetical protein EfmAA242_00280 [Enterococcus faecium]